MQAEVKSWDQRNRTYSRNLGSVLGMSAMRDCSSSRSLVLISSSQSCSSTPEQIPFTCLICVDLWVLHVAQCHIRNLILHLETLKSTYVIQVIHFTDFSVYVKPNTEACIYGIFDILIYYTKHHRISCENTYTHIRVWWWHVIIKPLRKSRNNVHVPSWCTPKLLMLENHTL